MTEFEAILVECLDNIEQGASSVDECLVRYPEHASELRPILLTSAYLDRGREINPPPAFKARVRARLTRDMQAHPRKARGFFGFPFVRLAAGFAAMTLAFIITVTAFAQNALPGQAFYDWKLASENVWRAVSPDPIGTHLAIAERRMNELLAVRDDPAQYALALEAYLEVVARLRSEIDVVNEARIQAVLESQMQELNESGIVLPQSDTGLPPQLEHPLPASTQIPSATPPLPAPTTIPLPTSALPTLPATPSNDVPPVVPTVEVPPILPTGLLP